MALEFIKLYKQNLLEQLLISPVPKLYFGFNSGYKTRRAVWSIYDLV